MGTDLRTHVERHGVTLAVALLALAALVEDLASPTVSSGGLTYDRGPEVLIAAVLTAAVVLVALAAGSASSARSARWCCSASRRSGRPSG